jgi:predicted ribosomally synthesized peptide with nif11-like leader
MEKDDLKAFIMSSSQLTGFLEAANNNADLLKELQSEGANPIQIAHKNGYSIDQNDLDALITGIKAWENSSSELRSFLQIVSQNPELQARLQQPGSDPIGIAAELGIKLNREEYQCISQQASASEVVELDDETLSQVTGGVVAETAAGYLVGSFMVGVVVPMIHVTAVAAIAVVGGAVVTGGAIAVTAGIAAYKSSQA